MYSQHHTIIASGNSYTPAQLASFSVLVWVLYEPERSLHQFWIFQWSASADWFDTLLPAYLHSLCRGIHS